MLNSNLFGYTSSEVKRVVKEQRIYRENSKKCKTCKNFETCKDTWQYHDVYKISLKVKPKSIACSKWKLKH